MSSPLKPTPPGWPRISSSLTYPNASAAIDWLCKAFGFVVKIKVEGEGGRIEHSELTFGESLIMVGDVKSDRMPYAKPPSAVGGANTQNLMVYVDDADAHCERARAAGATIVNEISISDYGEEYWSDRGYACMDIGGHHWWFCERLRTGKGQ